MEQSGWYRASRITIYAYISSGYSVFDFEVFHIQMYAIKMKTLWKIMLSSAFSLQPGIKGQETLGRFQGFLMGDRATLQEQKEP